MREAQEALRTSLADQIARTEVVAADAETARAEWNARKAQADEALGTLRAETETLRGQIAAMEKHRASALADSAEREAVLRRSLDAERERADQLDKDIADLFESEAKQVRKWEASRAELLERIRQLESAAENGPPLSDRLARAEEAEAAHADLRARISQLETAAHMADKARTELLSRKRDSDRALAAAQAEVTALQNKLAIAEGGRG
jgi:chromosome segregation ATPase